MNSPQEQMERFEGFALLEAMGHRKAAGYVTTKYFGPIAVFEVVQQEIPEHIVVLTKPKRINYELIPAGSKVKISRPRAVAFYAASSLYCLTPLTEDEANNIQPATFEVVERAPMPAAIAAAEDVDLFDASDPDEEEEWRERDQKDMPGGHSGEGRFIGNKFVRTS